MSGSYAYGFVSYSSILSTTIEVVEAPLHYFAKIHIIE